MSTILTDDEMIAAVGAPAYLAGGRTVEAAVLAKLARQEPVAWRWQERGHWFGWSSDWSDHDKAQEMGLPIEYAYPKAAPQQADRQRVPDGWNLVPVEPTREMWAAVNKLDNQCAAGNYDGKGCSIEQAWDCLLAAAPEAPAQAEKRCEWCDDTGDVIDQIGEWRGRCICPAGKPPKASAVDERDRKDAERYRWLRDALVSDDPYGLLEQAFGHLDKDQKPTAEDFDAGISAALAQKGGAA